MTRIALDAMGGDRAPDTIVQGLAEAIKDKQFSAFLIGDEKRIGKSLERYGVGRSVELVHASEVIGPDESPSMAVRRRRGSSIGVGVRMQKEGKVDAFVSAGSTGAVMAFSLLTLGRLGGVNRPAIAAFFPTKVGFSLVLDVGANSDCKPLNLLQFAMMGSIYLSYSFQKESPRVALLSMGEEDSKGNDLTLATHELLRSADLINFVGNIEASRILDGVADVVVCDGFVGNAILKFGEAIIDYVSQSAKESVRGGLKAKLGGLMLKSSFKKMIKRMNYEEYGGAPLLGIDGVVFACHGKSTPRAIRSALISTCNYVEGRVNEHIREELARHTP
ncbi:phosphate acyltransferase PlsX [candidate division TA06 bacterium]|uniref:Phosphate acyltransferase n=1 Tax=candidate division TA06 bacterium TaxID=2250710 RepID=A0A523UQ89_UNCT6|nr:MAG: phosphate acyltransferase PlsX [candidate division TA06 bacterium]